MYYIDGHGMTIWDRGGGQNRFSKNPIFKRFEVNFFVKSQ